MSDGREKEGREPGFRVIDKRGMSDEERAKLDPPPPPAAPPPAAGSTPPASGGGPAGSPEGNQPPADGVDSGRRPGTGARRESRLGPPGFADLVAAFQVPAMIHLGMVAPPGAGGRPIPPNLPAAKDVIDMLGVLQEKTKGNLDPREEEMLTGLLYELRMVYLEIFNSVAGTPGGIHP